MLINQLSYSHKRELDLYELKRFALSDKHPVTIRKQLSALVKNGLVSKRKNTLYGRYLYKVTDDIYPKDNNAVAIVEALDLRSFPDYLTAAIINKLRQAVLQDKETISFSINELREELSADRSISTIRNIILKLESNGFLSKQLVGRRYRYNLNSKKLLRIFDNEVTKKQSQNLLDIFIKYSGEEISDKTKSSWLATFRNIIISGYDYEYLKHIIAYIHKSKYHIDKVRTPSHIKHYFDDLKRESVFNLSRRKANRYIYKLINDELVKKVKPVEKSSNQLIWEKVEVLVTKSKRSLATWFYNHSVGVSEITLDDYIQEARLLFFKDYAEYPNKDDSYRCNTVKYAMQTFMTKRRPVSDSKKTLVQFVDCDITDIEYKLSSELKESESEDDEPHFDTKGYIRKLLDQLDPRSAAILSDYYGFKNGKEMSYRELGKKYKLDHSRIYAIIKRAKSVLQKNNEPPEEFDPNPDAEDKEY